LYLSECFGLGGQSVDERGKDFTEHEELLDRLDRHCPDESAEDAEVLDGSEVEEIL